MLDFYLYFSGFIVAIILSLIIWICLILPFIYAFRIATRDCVALICTSPSQPYKKDFNELDKVWVIPRVFIEVFCEVFVDSFNGRDIDRSIAKWK